MYDLDAIEAINVDQLVTATDRILLRSAYRCRPQTRRTVELAHAAQLALALSAARRRAQQAADEQTVFVRGIAPRRQLLGAAALCAGAWLGVVCACLLA